MPENNPASYNLKNDPMMWQRLEWMREYQPEFLRELVKKPAKLMETLEQAVQSAKRTQWESRQKGADLDQANELAQSVLCPADSPSPMILTPITDQEWTGIQKTVKSAPVPM